MHIAAVSPFTQYFADSNRLVTIDASSGAMEPIWDAVHHFFTSLHLTAWRPVNSVLVFALGKGCYLYEYPVLQECSDIRQLQFPLSLVA